MAIGGMGGLAQGLAYGLQMGWNQNERERQAARQEKLDAQNEQLFNERLDALKDERTDRENKRAIDRTITDTMSAGQTNDNAGAVTYTNPNGEQTSAYQPDLQTAQFAAQQQANEEGSAPTAPAIQSNPAAQQASSVRTLDGGRKLFTGLTAASDAKKYSDENSPSSYAKYMALSEKLAGMAGGQEKADQYLQRAKALDKENAFKALSMMYAGDMEGAAKAFNSTGQRKLSPGNSFVQTTDEKGNKIFNVVDKDGNVVLPHIEQRMIDYIGGPEAVVAQAQADRKLKSDLTLKKWEYENDPTKRYKETKPGGQVFDTKTNTYIASNEMGYEPKLDAAGNVMYDSDGDPIMVRGSGTGRGAGGAGKGGAGKTPDIIEKTLKGNEAGIATATGLYRSLLSNNPGMPDEEASSIAIRAGSGANRRAVFNTATGMFDEYYDDKPQLDKDGKPTGYSSNKSYLIQSHSYSPKGAIPDAEAQKAVKQMQEELPKAQFDSYVAASTPEAYNAYKTKANDAFIGVVEKAKADIAATQADTTLTPQQRAQKLQAIQGALGAKQNDLQADVRRLDLVRQLYKAPPPDNSAPNAKPTNGDWRKNYLGLGQNKPDQNSPAGRYAARQVEGEKRQQEAAAAQQALSKQFAADKASMSTEDFVRKYDSLRGQLPTADAAELQRVERQL